MSFIPQYHMGEYNTPFVPANIDSKNMSSLIQRARFLQSQGANEQNNIELAQIQQQLKHMQSNAAPRYPNNLATTPTTLYQPQAKIIKKVTNEDHCILLPHQLNALKNQIMAYKLLSKDIPIPPQLQQAVLAPFNSLLSQSSPPITPVINAKSISPQKQQQQQQYQPYYQSYQPPITPEISHEVAILPTIPSNHYPSTPVPNNPHVKSSFPRKTKCNAYIPPSNLLVNPITLYAHRSRQQRLLVPSLLPTGIDPQAIKSQREQRIMARMQYRYQQPNYDLQDHIHTKALNLYYKQSKLRSELFEGVSKSTTLATSTERTAFRRMKKVSLRESRHIEAVEQQQRTDRDESIQIAKNSRLTTICEHGLGLMVANKTNKTKLGKLGHAVVNYHQYLEKAEQKRMERITKERMLALKNDNEEAYIKLLDEAKDTRLTDLLKQTGLFLQSLTKSVVEQQNTNKYVVIDDKEQQDQDGASADYFSITHKIQEDVCQPSIMMGGQLKDYQVKGLQWMVSLYNNNLNGILADEMGLGKTIQTISLITYLIEKKRQNGPFLIIAPLSTLTNWTLEFDKWAPSVSKILYKGPPQTRKELANIVQSGHFQVLLTTFEYIIRDTHALCGTKWLYLIMDEGHRMKNANSKLTVTLRQSYHARYRLILTGTPLQNNLPELWALLNFILPKIFKSVKTFEEWFNTPFANQGAQDKIDLNEEEQLLIIKRLHKVLRPFLLRRLKSDVESELPDKVERLVKCKQSSLQLKIYQQLKNTSAIYTNNNDDSPIAIKGLNNTIMQLRKVCNHPFVFDGVENALNPRGKSNDLLYRCSGKFELLDRMLPKLKKTGHRVLIFFQMTSIMNIMEDYLNWRNYHYLRLDGSTKSDDRSTLLYHFNQPDSPYFIFLLSTRAGGLGLNLQSADTVIIFDSDWNPHQDLQAQDRAHRIGQTKEVRIFRLVTSNSVEERILARTQYKLGIDGKVIQAGKFDNRSTEADREALLRTLLEDKIDEEDEEDDYNGNTSNDELNEMLKRSDEELTVFKMIDIEREKEKSSSRERLVQEDELLNVFDQPANAIIDPSLMTFDFDRNRKAKEDVRYGDGLTDEQFLRAIERGDEIPQLTKKRSLQIAPKSSRKRNRVDIKKALEIDTISRLVRKQLTEIFEACYKKVEDSIEFEDDNSYRQRCDLFMNLVDKKEYPDYYTLIKNPISMNMIKERIHSFYYENIQEFKNDFHVMFENARIFNEEGSIVYQDADEMEKILDQQLEKECPRGVLPKYQKKKTTTESEYIEDYEPEDNDDY